MGPAPDAPDAPAAGHLPLSLERDLFLRTLLRELTGTLQDVVGLEEASGFISVVGQRVGEWLDAEYRAGLRVDRLSRHQVAEVLVDLKRRIQGTFRVVEETPERLVLVNGHCPFGDAVLGRPALCMMTSNVFGHLSAQNLGYAKVELQRTIARGDAGCRVVIHLVPDETAAGAGGREYFQL